MRQATSPLFGLLLAVAMTLLSVTAAFAHERRDVGDYAFVVGWLEEPAIEGQRNGVDLRVSDPATEQPIEGLEETLQVEITYLPSETTRVFTLRPIFRDPGHYTVDLLLTAAGEYRFRFFGTIEGAEVDEVFNSAGAGGGFNDVAPSADIQFPQQVPELRELAGVVQGLQEDGGNREEAGDSAGSTLDVIALAVGSLGLVVGSSALVLGRRR